MSTTKTNEQLLAIAEEIVDGRIFASWSIKEEDDVVSSFPALVLMGKKLVDEMIKKQIVAIYEHLSEAGPIAVNGRPVFFSFHSITKDEMDRLVPMIEKLLKSREEIKNEILNEKVE